VLYYINALSYVELFLEYSNITHYYIHPRNDFYYISSTQHILKATFVFTLSAKPPAYYFNALM